jgi:hypothetical protein
MASRPTVVGARARNNLATKHNDEPQTKLAGYKFFLCKIEDLHKATASGASSIAMRVAIIQPNKYKYLYLIMAQHTGRDDPEILLE